MSVAASGTTEASARDKYVISIRGNMSESPTNEASKADRKREYNRNAQRVFRQRRKEHLKNLEAAQQKQSTVQSEEIQRLKEENLQLRQENQSLKQAYESESSSPTALTTSPTTTMVANSFAGAFNAATASYVAMPPSSNTGAIANVVASMPSNICVITPHSLTEIRRSLHALFATILEVHVISNAQTHLNNLALLAPQLPAALKPTELQLTTPHHAYIDLIPSPSLRDRLIGIGPAHASAFMAQACPFACDIEDQGQLTIWGEDWLNEFSWEFSEAVLTRWGGWVLDRQWGQRANFWRRQRGLHTLPTFEG